MSSDGKLLAAGGSDDSALKFYTVDNGSLLRAVDGMGGAVYMTRFNPSATFAVISTADQGLKAVEVATGTMTTIDAVIGYVTGVDFSPDGRWMCAPVGGGVVVWDARTWKELRRLEGHLGGATFASFSPDGRAIASTGADGVLKLWEVPTGRLISTPAVDLPGTARARFAADGRSVVTAGGSGRIRIFGLPGDVRPEPKPAPPPTKPDGIPDEDEADWDLEGD